MTRNLLDRISFAELTEAYTNNANPQGVAAGLMTIVDQGYPPRPELLAHAAPGEVLPADYPALEAAVRGTNATPHQKQDMLREARRHAVSMIEASTVVTMASTILSQIGGGHLSEKGLDKLAQVGRDKSTAVYLEEEGGLTVRATFRLLGETNKRIAADPTLDFLRVGRWTLLKASMERRLPNGRFGQPLRRRLGIALDYDSADNLQLKLEAEGESDGRPINQRLVYAASAIHYDPYRRAASLGALIDATEEVLRRDATFNPQGARDLLARLNAPTH